MVSATVLGDRKRMDRLLGTIKRGNIQDRLVVSQFRTACPAVSRARDPIAAVLSKT